MCTRVRMSRHLYCGFLYMQPRCTAPRLRGMIAPTVRLVASCQACILECILRRNQHLAPRHFARRQSMLPPNRKIENIPMYRVIALPTRLPPRIASSAKTPTFDTYSAYCIRCHFRLCKNQTPKNQHLTLAATYSPPV